MGNKRQMFVDVHVFILHTLALDLDKLLPFSTLCATFV